MRGCVIFFVIFLTKIWCSQVIYAKEGQNCHDVQFYLNMCTVVGPIISETALGALKNAHTRKKIFAAFQTEIATTATLDNDVALTAYGIEYNYIQLQWLCLDF